MKQPKQPSAIVASPAAPNCRSIESLAAVWGIALYVRGPKRQEQITRLIALKDRPDFPAKVKGYWPRAEVIQWGMEHLDVSEDGRRFEVRSAEGGVRNQKGAATDRRPAKNSELRTPNSELEADLDLPDVVSAAEREKILSRFPPGYQKRFRELYEMWENPNPIERGKTLTEKQHQELIDIGLVKRGSELVTAIIGNGKPAPVDVPDYCSQSEFARLMSEIYNVPVYPMLVTRAINEEGMPGKMSNQSIKTSLAIPWWEKNKVLKDLDGQGNLFQKATAAELQRKIDEARTSKMEADEMERATSDKWILNNTHELTMTTFGVQVKNAAREAIEKQLPKAFSEALDEIVLDEVMRGRLLEKVRANSKAAFSIFQTALRQRCEELLESSKPKNKGMAA